MAITIKDAKQFMKLFTGSMKIDFNNLKILPSLYGRVCKGKYPEHFLALTDNTTDRTCFCMDSDAILNMLKFRDSSKHVDILLSVGFTKKYIQAKLDTGYRFELCVLQPKPSSIHQQIWTTWSGVLKVIFISCSYLKGYSNSIS